MTIASIGSSPSSDRPSRMASIVSVRHALLHRFAFVSRPFKLTIAAARRDQNGDFPYPPGKAGFIAKIASHRTGEFRVLRAVQIDAAGAAKSPDGLGVPAGKHVVDRLCIRVERISVDERQAAAGHGIDIVGSHVLTSLTHRVRQIVILSYGFGGFYAVVLGHLGTPGQREHPLEVGTLSCFHSKDGASRGIGIHSV